MCGIAGFSGARSIAPSRIKAMLRALAERGPDARRVVTWDEGHRREQGEARHALLATRLAIIDPRPVADQPMANDTGDLWIAYNGEVYGWQDHARELEAAGARFRTRSDTEFILRAYEAWGLDMLAKLRGMFAIALLDLRRKKLVLVRDRMGLKPLVYSHIAGEIGFASTVRALLPYLPSARRRFSVEAIDAYLAHRYIPAPRTVFEDIRRLPNGHYLEYDLATGGLHETTYWKPQPKEGDWRSTLDEAIRLRTIADRPVGIFLSGGVDSAVLASRLAAQGFSQLHAYTAAFPGDPLDEAADAGRTAAMLGLPHTAIEMAPDLGKVFPRIVADLDEPFADPSAFPMWYLSRGATKEVKVVLAGEGADELFGGYKRYAKHRRTAWRRGFTFASSRVRAGAGTSSWARVAMELSLPWEHAYALRFSGFSPSERAWLQPALKTTAPVYWRAPDVNHGGGPMETMLALDMANYLPEYILRKGDLTTMAHGLELRAPFLDHELYERILAIPPRERFTRPAKAVLEPLCPPCRRFGLMGRSKRGFNPPLERWLLKDLAAPLAAAGERLEQLTSGQIAQSRVAQLVGRHQAGESALAEKVLQLAILAESLEQLRATDG